MFDVSTEAAFVRSIVRNPDDDAPRLIYADWLDEQGDANRAEFIRLQIRLAQLPSTDADYPHIRRRVRDLEHDHQVEWANRLPRHEGVHYEILERGFVSAVKFVDPDAFFRHSERVLGSAPIQELRLHQFQWNDASRLGDCKQLRSIRILDMNEGNRIGNQGTEALMKSPHIRELRILKLGQNSLGPAAIRAIAMAPYMRELRELKLERNDLYDDALTFLAESSNLVHLRDLDMDRTRTGDTGLQRLATSKHVRNLEVLNLSNNQISAEGLESLMRSAVMAKVVSLFLQNNSLGERGARAIADSPHLQSLVYLFLRQNNIRDAGARALAQSAYLPVLQHLYLGENQISDLAAHELRTSRGTGVNVY